MRIELGDSVVSQDGHAMGAIKHLILDPANGLVKFVVIEKGLILHDDIEVPLTAFQEVSAPDQAVRLEYTAEQVKSLPRFDITRYTPAPPEQTPAFLGGATGGALWPAENTGQPFVGAAYPLGAGILPPILPVIADEINGQLPVDQPQEAREYQQREDEENAVISIGDMVVSRDGETVGEVHSVTIDTQAGRPTALVVRKGFLFTQDTTLLADSIASVEDGVITLNLDKSQMPS